MKNKKILSQTNPYLRDRAQRLSGLFRSVSSSSAIEGIAARDLLTNYLHPQNASPTSGRSAASGQSQR